MFAKKENLLDRMDTTELAANQFRMTQTRDKLGREAINQQQQAIHAHETVGREVREAIKRIGGTMPEKIPAAEPISAVEKRIKSAAPVLALGEKDAKGLVGEGENLNGYGDVWQAQQGMNEKGTTGIRNIRCS